MIGPYGVFLKKVLLMYTLEGLSSVANFITASEESQRRVFPVCNVFPKAISKDFLLQVDNISYSK